MFPYRTWAHLPQGTMFPHGNCKSLSPWENPLPKDVASPHLVREVLDKIAQGLHPLIHLHVEENEKLKK